MSTVKNRPAARSLPRAQKAAAFIEANLAQDISLMDVCRHTNTSRCQMCRLLRSTLGRTFCEYLTDRRIDQAKDMLLQTELPSQQIAASCGFASASYFTTVFRKRTGLPPARFRAQNRSHDAYTNL